MLFFLLFVVLAAAASANWAPARAGATYTRSALRARQVLGLVCGVMALLGFSRFVWFVLLRGHDWHSSSVFIGQAVSVTLLAQAIVFGRRARPARWTGMLLGGWCAVLSMLALARGVMWIASQ